MAKTQEPTSTPALNTEKIENSLKESTFTQLTVAQLEEMINKAPPSDPLVYINLMEKLKGLKKQEFEDNQKIRMSVGIYQNLLAKERQQEMVQRGCEMNRHMREDNRSALVGQHDNNHDLNLVCQRCFKEYHGIGNGPGQLPMQLAQTVDMSLVGGVN